MKVLVVFQHKFIFESILDWISLQQFKPSLVASDNYHESSEILASEAIDLVIIEFYSDLDFRKFKHSSLYKIALKMKVYQVIITLSTAPSSLLPALESNIAAIIHFNDARKYFQYTYPKPTIEKVFISETIYPAISVIPERGHPLTTLTCIEQIVAAHIVLGLSSKEISEKIYRSFYTIKDHRKHIKEKLDITGGKSALMKYLTPYTHWLLSIANQRHPSEQPRIGY